MSFVLYTTENEALASMLDYNEDSKSLYAKAMANMDPNVVKYKNIAVTKLDNDITGVVVDGTSANEVTNTQVIFYSRDLAILRNPLFKEKAKIITRHHRSSVRTLTRTESLKFPLRLIFRNRAVTAKIFMPTKSFGTALTHPRRRLLQNRR